MRDHRGLPTKTSTIVAIDDDPMIHRLVTVMLRSMDAEIVCASEGDEGLELVRSAEPDLVLLDYELPGMTGLDVLTRLKSDTELASTPVVFATGSDSHQVLSACFAAGAADYVRKPFCAAELQARVRSVLDRRQLMGQLEHLAYRDVLTGLPNRRSIRDRIQTVLDQASKDSHYGLLFLDFDRFKLVNDSLGHDVGDLLLQEISVRLTEGLRRTDAVARISRSVPGRLGGDEFVVLLDDLAKPDDAIVVADRLLDLFNEPYQLAGHKVTSTASIGVVMGDGSHRSADDMLRDADTAMYEAKKAGRSRYVVFTHEMRAAVERRMLIETELREAVANEELYLEYQPIVSLEDGQTHAFEALVRWAHPTRGRISPGEFIPIAEETGLIIPLGAWVLREACLAFKRIQSAAGEAALRAVHVNLARQQLTLPDLAPFVLQVLEETGVAPQSLHLEVTESEIMQDPKAATALLTELSEVGIQIDMDDFGTGYSSLACLKEFPIDVLKIDRTFVANIGDGKGFSALLHAVTTLAKNLDLAVVAEGVETAAQLALLQSLDCEYAQGFLFSKSLPEDQAIEYLKEHG